MTTPTSVSSSSRRNRSIVPADPRLRVYENYDLRPALTAWTNAQLQEGGAQDGGVCVHKVSNATAGVKWYLGGQSWYEQSKPYDFTFRMKSSVAVSLPGGDYTVTPTDWAYCESMLRWPNMTAGFVNQINPEWDTAGEADLQIDELRIRRATNEEWAQHGLILASSLGASARPSTALDQLELLPNTMAKLRNGGTLKLMLMGDSYQYGLAGTTYDGYLMQKFPNCEIITCRATIGSTGATGWDAQINIDTWCVPHEPDLIYFGGISSAYTEHEREHWASVINMLRTTEGTSQAEIMIGSKANGLDPDTSAYCASVAEDNDVAYFDASATCRNFYTDSGKTFSDLTSDGTHFNAVGAQIMAQDFAAFFGVTF